MRSASRTLHLRPVITAAALLIASVAFAERPTPGPLWEVGLGVEHISITAPGNNSNSGFGGQPVFGRISLLGALTSSMSDGAWMAGDYLGLGVGGWYGNDAQIRLPLELGLQVGAVVANEFQVVVRGGITGVGTFGGLDAGGYGAMFLGGRVKWSRFAGEVNLGPRMDTEEGGFAGLIQLMGRFYLTRELNLGLRFTNAERGLGSQTTDTLGDRSFLLFLSWEE